MARQKSSDGREGPASMAPATQRFLAAASEAAAIRAGGVRHADDRVRLAKFRDIYRTWIIRERGMDDAPQSWAEKSSILLHLMVGGSTVAEAIEILVKFRESVWGQETKLSLEDRGEDVAIVVSEPMRHGAEGLVCELWPMVVNLSHLEFLAGGELDGVRGEVRNARRLPGDVTNLLFGRPITFEAGQTALVIPKSELSRAVTVRSSDVAEFQRRFMQSLVDRTARAAEMRSRVATLIWNDAARGAGGLSSMPDVAERLGLSPATLRRRLQDEQTNFQAIKDEVIDQLAKMRLRTLEESIEEVAAHLGYSDAHAFRRAFKRRNGVSPRAWRRSPPA